MVRNFIVVYICVLLDFPALLSIIFFTHQISTDTPFFLRVNFMFGLSDFQQENSTQVFILSDKPKDANFILISFRGTEPFDADDWSTDFDYSWYEIPKLGKVHMGFLEALGLGNRSNAATFQNHLQVKDTKFTSSSRVDISQSGFEKSSNSEEFVSIGEKELSPEMVEMTAYYAVRSKLRSLLKEHKNAKFLVTGHSLGGALAILFPTVLLLHEEEELMQRLLGIYTFGQPRAGNIQLGEFMEAHLNNPTPKYFRVVYCNDLVPRLPYDDRTFLYKHFGVCLYYDSCYIERVISCLTSCLLTHQKIFIQPCFNKFLLPLQGF